MDHKKLLAKLERTLDEIESSEATATMVRSILESIVSEYGKDLGIVGGRLYFAANSHYELLSQTGDSHAPEDFKISMDYECIQILKKDGQILASTSHPCFDPAIEQPLNISCFAAIMLGDSDEYMISFTLAEPINEEQVQYFLSAIRHVGNIKIRHTRLETYISEARRIQQSLLPSEFPDFFGFDIYGRSISSEIVGGDIFDIIRISENMLGLAIADASGHGLPAALQVRDVYVGLRMGIAQDLKIVRTMQKLNQVLSHAGKKHEFVTLFYAELEDNGNLFYSNAGHNPPLFFGNTAISKLDRGGLILGPFPKAKYERGFVFFDPGNIMVVYTDGITEAVNAFGEEFGTDGIIEVVNRNKQAGSQEICSAIFESVQAFTESTQPKDDQTVLVVKRAE